MGINNTYIITIKEEDRAKAVDYLLANCNINPNQLPNPLESKDNCLSLKVKVDIPIKRYLRNYYRYGRYNSDYQEQKIEHLISDGYSKIGCVDIDTKEFDSKINLRFVCVASTMSELFTDSESIRNWFIELCKATNAETGMYDRENHYIELFWYKGIRKSLKVGDKILNEIVYPIEDGISSLKEPIRNLLKSGFDYSYELERK